MTSDILIPAVAPDGSLFPIGKLKAHADAVLHLAVSVFVFDGGELLIQRRAASKYHSGGLWANTCCSHPHWDETLESCAARRLQEELGCRVPLKNRRVIEYSTDVGGGLHEHERVAMFVGDADKESLSLSPDAAEVAQTRWITLEDLKAEMRARPRDFAPWFRIYLKMFPDLRL